MATKTKKISRGRVTKDIDKEFSPADSVKKGMEAMGATAVAPLPAFDRSKIKIKRLVTLPQWKWVDGEEKLFRVEGPIHLGSGNKKEKLGADGKPMMEIPHIAHVTRLDTGDQCEIIVGAMLKSELEEKYPAQSYVGKCFMSKFHKIPHQRWASYSLAEIEIAP